ncbi:MAG: selenide, water dikinase SelD, partial [Chitinophagaceae bacterium]
NLKQNNAARVGDLLLMTKSLGTGVLSTAQKRNALDPVYYDAFVNQLVRLNKIGAALGEIEGVHAMTDITGFGILGHLIEMTGGSGVSANIYVDKLPLLEGVNEGIAHKYIPGGTIRNWNSYGHHVSIGSSLNEADARALLADPQTNGGLLIAVSPSALSIVQEMFSKSGLQDYLSPIGEIIKQDVNLVFVK